jgi:Adenosine deaminase
MRGEGNDSQNEETLRLAKKYLVEDGGVAAIDLAGAEALYPTSKYEKLFHEAAALNVPFTIHAGEADGPESVRLAVQFGAKRIGHGVRIYEDPKVLKLIKDKGITLEMCPTSNRMTKAVPDMDKYPLIDYLEQGIRVTVNTDDMGIEDITLADEFQFLKERFNLSDDQRNIILKNSIDAAFTTNDIKSWLRQEIL